MCPDALAANAGTTSGETASELNASKAAAMVANCRVCPRLSFMAFSPTPFCCNSHTLHF
jgi:hypothetical protein